MHGVRGDLDLKEHKNSETRTHQDKSFSHAGKTNENSEPKNKNVLPLPGLGHVRLQLELYAGPGRRFPIDR